MTDPRPLTEALHAALRTTRLEPEIDDATLLAYAEGIASPVDREIVETMMEVDPAFAEAIAAMREALEEAKTPLPAPPIPRIAKPRRNAFAWLSPAVSLAALAGAFLMVSLGPRETDRLRPPLSQSPKATPLKPPLAAPTAEPRSMAETTRAAPPGAAMRPQARARGKAAGSYEPQAEDPLTHGLQALRLGRIDEARREFKKLARTEPALAARLLRALG